MNQTVLHSWGLDRASTCGCLLADGLGVACGELVLTSGQQCTWLCSAEAAMHVRMMGVWVMGPGPHSNTCWQLVCSTKVLSLLVS